jgi:hypothetical protein
VPRFAVAVVLLVVAAGCGSDGDEAAITSRTTTGAVDAGRSDPSGDYQREVTQAELESIGEVSRPEGWQPPPAGMYRLTLTSGTIVVVDPDEFSVAQELTVAEDTLRIGRYVGEGAFCPDDRDSTYAVQIDGDELVLSPRRESCGDREAILTGTWTKTG